ncbi:MAG: carbamate kinase [Candidatus Korobacteraceae bacterium]|jgi:carbamate kinase
MSKTALVAVGGNSLIRAGEKGTIVEQLANARRTARAMVGLIRLGYRLVITHGNGPQVGAQLLRSERASDVVYSQTLDVCGAASQGEVGYLLEQSLRNELAGAGIDVPVVSLVTQTVVSPDDPAMQRPSKPIGPFYSRAGAEERKRVLGWHIVEDAARGYRRVVPSPEPLEIVELDVIRSLVARKVLVLSTGGGGIPVTRVGGQLRGLEAVIDKDRASALLAAQLGVDLFAICTDTDYVYLNYKKPEQTPLTYVTVAQLEEYHRAGHFPPGNMGPKIESVIHFLRRGGKEAVITSFELLCVAVAGRAGTHIVGDAGPSPETASQELEVPVLR